MLLNNNYELEKEMRGEHYLKINLLGNMLHDMVDDWQPFLEHKYSQNFISKDIKGCKSEYCNKIGFEDLDGMCFK